jgi:hypothetical protein
MPAEDAKQIKEVKDYYIPQNMSSVRAESASKETGSQKWTSAQRES